MRSVIIKRINYQKNSIQFFFNEIPIKYIKIGKGIICWIFKGGMFTNNQRNSELIIKRKNLIILCCRHLKKNAR